MWFDSNLDDAWRIGFKPALEACNLKPVRIDLEEHNEKICDLIMLRIRQSGLVVADFTGQRGGVYFESGFAMGLGIPVIRTCQKGQENQLHFDTRQYNHILWNSPADLKDKLENRIRATVPALHTVARPHSE
jgi:nucleoside 2-deoxyribosyltransferase